MNAPCSLPATAEAIGRRVLHWIAEVRSPHDLSPKRLEAEIGVPMVHAPDGSGAGLQGPDALKNVAAAMALKAQQENFTSIDAIVPNAKGDGPIAVQGQDISAPGSRNLLVDIAQASRQPAELSLAQLQTPATPPSETQSPTQDAPSQGRGMTT